MNRNSILFVFVLVLMLLFGCQSQPKQFSASHLGEWVQGTKPLSQSVDNFSLLDQNGKAHELDYYSDTDAIVLVSHGVGCPIVRQSYSEIERIVKKFYKKKNVVFFFINANPQDEVRDLLKESEEFDVKIPILKDKTQLISRSLLFERTADVLVLEPSTKRVLYSGPIFDRLNYGGQKSSEPVNFLDDYLVAYSQEGFTKSIKRPGVKGCRISYFTEVEEVSYSKSIVPILERKCLSCHVQGGLGPWAMKDFRAINGWSAMMREVIRARRMPPWMADDSDIYTFQGNLSADEEVKIVTWINQGAKNDSEEKDPLVEAHQRAKQRLEKIDLGDSPDITIALDPQKIPATGILPYRDIELAFAPQKDLWIRQVNVVPTNKKVLHHAFLQPPNPAPGQLYFYGGYAPGMKGDESLPKDSGIFLAAGTRLKLQTHFITTGREEVVGIKIFIYLHKSKPKYEFKMLNARGWSLDLEPHAKNQLRKASKVFKDDTIVVSAFPHMHFRGRDMKYELLYPNGEKKLLAWFPRYNVNFQREYPFAKWTRVPKGSKLLCEATFDNSAQNAQNPDPEQAVSAGFSSIDEMMICFLGIIEPS